MRLFVALADPVALERLHGLAVRRQWQAAWFDDNGDEVPGVMVDVEDWRQDVRELDDYMSGQGYARVPMMAHVKREPRVWIAHAERYEPVP